MRRSQNLSHPPRIYPAFPEYRPTLSPQICDPPRIYPSLQNIPLLRRYMHTPKIYPSVPEYTHPLNIYMRHSRNPPSNPKYTPILNIYMRPSQNLSLHFIIYTLLYQVELPESTPSLQNIPPFSTTICDAPKIYPVLPESTPPSQYIPPPPKYAKLPESTPPFRIYPLLHHYMRHSHNLPLPSRIYPPLNLDMRLWPETLLESTPSSQNIRPLFNIHT